MWLLFLLMTGWGSGAAIHDFHVSKALMSFVPEDEALQISMHIFLDDLELALEQEGHPDLFLCTEREAAGADALILAYLQQHFSLDLNEQPTPYQWVGKEISDDLAACWIYLEVRELKELRTIEVTNRILMDTYDDQQNIIHLEMPDGRNGYFLFDHRNATETATF